jgi:hypothetical protein
MMTKVGEQMRRAALAMSRADLIDTCLRWIEQLSVIPAPAQVNRLACIKIRIDVRRDR